MKYLTAGLCVSVCLVMAVTTLLPLAYSLVTGKMYLGGHWEPVREHKKEFAAQCLFCLFVGISGLVGLVTFATMLWRM